MNSTVGAAVPRDQPLMEAGLDSIAAVELRNAVSAKFGVDLPATVTFDHPTIDALALYISHRTAVASQGAAIQRATQLRQVCATLD